MQKGFTLIELIIVIAITAILSGVVLFSVTKYIAKGKDANISGNLAVLIPAGEVWYNESSNSYAGFCASPVVSNAKNQMPSGTSFNCHVDSTVGNNGQAWAACAKEFGDPTKAYCVDSTGLKEEICESACTASLTNCPSLSEPLSCS